MSLKEHQERIQNQLDTHLESPIPILSKLKTWILGKDKPDTYTQVSFYVGLAIFGLIATWLILGYSVVSNTMFIEQEKGIPVHEIIQELGRRYGFTDELFLSRLINFYHLALFSWVTILIGLVLQWRKNKAFIYFILVGASLYLVGMWSMLSFSYWYHEISFFDKLIYFILVFHSLLYYYFLNKEKKGEKVNFFGLDNSDEDE